MNRTIAAILVISAAVSSCSLSGNYFSVANDGGTIESVEVHICNQVANLPERAARFSDHIHIDCEGSGEFQVRMKDGREVTCVIGYVTPGLSQKFEYEIIDGECQPQHIRP